MKARKRSDALLSSVDFTLIMISTENSKENCDKHIQDYLNKIPESEKWKRTLSVLLHRFALVSMASKTTTRTLE